MSYEKVQMPAFGDILNAGIQTIKKFSNRHNGIPQKTFFNQVYKLSGITDKHLEIKFINEDYARFSETDEEMLDECVYRLTDLMLTCMIAIGIIKDYIFNLQPNIGQTFANFITFDETVTVDNLSKIDPFGKIYFWLATENFRNYDILDVSPSSYKSDLQRFDNKSFRILRKVNDKCYGKQGDPLINHLIQETMRRTSVFMNNYANVVTANNFVEVTPNMLLSEIMGLTPLQFEHLCLKVVEVSLKNEEPNAKLTCIHTGKTNDGGIDGKIIQQFNNGEIHTYYIQAKQHQNNVSNSNLRNFVGAYPPDKKFHHGIFMATSNYTKSAEDYAKQLDSHSLTLVNQFALLELMIEHEIGLEKIKTEMLVMNKKFFKNLRKK